MKILLVSWMLLLYGVCLNSGHYIRKLEDADDSEVYRVTEDHSGVKFVNPKPERPTLREISYYHIVERAFGKEEPSITERSFTNSHGVQFLKDMLSGASTESEHFDDDHEQYKEYKENDESEYEETGHENKLEDEIQDEGEREQLFQDTEPVAETEPLTDQDVKEVSIEQTTAYKHRRYLFDQLRQRYSPVKRMILPDSLSRRKREANLEEIPNAPELPGSSQKDAYMQPNTYGMNLNSDGGYVWNNLNNPTVYYELGQSTGNPNEGQGQSESGQSQENTPEINVPQVTENTDLGSSEDIYVSTGRQPATPLGNPEVTEEKEPGDEEVTSLDNQEITEDKPENQSGIEGSEEPIYNPNENLEFSESVKPIEPVISDSAPENNPTVEKPEFESPEKSEFGESKEPNEPVNSELDTVGSTESSNGDKIKEIPEAPTLPPLNFDSLPDYIRDAISSTEKSETQEQTGNPFINPQLDPEDKKTLEEKMEDIFATAQPVEDIPKTYGVNLTGDSGHVWNDMVNPPVSYDVGTDKKEEEPKAPEPTGQPNQESQEEPKHGEQPALEIPEDNKEAEVPEIPEVPELEKPELPQLENTEIKEAEVPKVPELENPEDKEAEVPEILEVPEVTPEPVPENPEVEDKPAELEPVEPTPENKEPEEGTEEAGDQLPAPKPEVEKKPDIMSELLKSDQFWKWLGEWTATYMELLEKHMRKIAIQEICNREKTGTEMCLLNDKPKDNGLEIKDSKVILDGKEIPVTHNSNFDLRRGNKDKDNANKIHATTIYGNSVGNEKVNNVFIFNAADAKEVLEELKPGNDSKLEIIIDERNKESKEDERTDEVDKIDEAKVEVDEKKEDKIEPKESGEKQIEEKEIEDKPVSSELESDKESTEKTLREES